MECQHGLVNALGDRAVIGGYYRVVRLKTQPGVYRRRGISVSDGSGKAGVGAGDGPSFPLPTDSSA